MKLIDYLPYYLGCNVIIDQGTNKEDRGKLMGGTFIPNSINQIYYHIQTADMPYNDDADEPARIKPIIRRLEDMTEEEKVEIFGSDVHWFKPFDSSDACDIQQWHKLLQQGFDLFSLIDNGLAMDAKTLQP